MMGVTADRRTPLLIENKLWAGLTEHQPMTYIERLPDGGVLLFVVPEQRKQTLRLELDDKIDRSAAASPGVWSTGGTNQTVLWRQVGSTKSLAIVGWEILLDHLKVAVANEGKDVTAADVDQLRGFCEAASGAADKFIPFNAEHISGREIPTLLSSLRLVVDRAVERAKTEADLQFVGKRQYKDLDSYGWDFECDKIRFYFGIYIPAWGQFGNSPLWIGLPKDGHREEIFKVLVAHLADSQGAIHPSEVPHDSTWYIPVFLEPNAPEGTAVDGIIRQLRKLKGVIAAITP
jgi:hypothetical protein